MGLQTDVIKSPLQQLEIQTAKSPVDRSSIYSFDSISTTDRLLDKLDLGNDDLFDEDSDPADNFHKGAMKLLEKFKGAPVAPIAAPKNTSRYPTNIHSGTHPYQNYSHTPKSPKSPKTPITQSPTSEGPNVPAKSVYRPNGSYNSPVGLTGVDKLESYTYSKLHPNAANIHVKVNHNQNAQSAPIVQSVPNSHVQNVQNLHNVHVQNVQNLPNVHVQNIQNVNQALNQRVHQNIQHVQQRVQHMQDIRQSLSKNVPNLPTAQKPYPVPKDKALPVQPIQSAQSIQRVYPIVQRPQQVYPTSQDAHKVPNINKHASLQDVHQKIQNIQNIQNVRRNMHQNFAKNVQNIRNGHNSTEQPDIQTVQVKTVANNIVYSNQNHSVDSFKADISRQSSILDPRVSALANSSNSEDDYDEFNFNSSTDSIEVPKSSPGHFKKSHSRSSSNTIPLKSTNIANMGRSNSVDYAPEKSVSQSTVSPPDSKRSMLDVSPALDSSKRSMLDVSPTLGSSKKSILDKSSTPSHKKVSSLDSKHSSLDKSPTLDQGSPTFNKTRPASLDFITKTPTKSPTISNRSLDYSKSPTFVSKSPIVTKSPTLDSVPKIPNLDFITKSPALDSFSKSASPECIPLSPTAEAFPRSPTQSNFMSAEDRILLSLKLRAAGKHREASYQLQIAANAPYNDLRAMYLYAVALKRGEGVKFNNKNALKWLCKCVVYNADPEYPNLHALTLEDLVLVLAEMLDNDICETDPFKLYDHFSVIPSYQLTRLVTACKYQHNTMALVYVELGNFLFNGIATDKDEVRGIRCLSIAGSMGDYNAMNQLGEIWTTKSKYHKKDNHLASAWLRLSELFGLKSIGNSWIYKEKYLKEQSS